MLQIGEIVGLLEAYVSDKSKKVNYVNIEYGILTEISSAVFDKTSDSMVISNATGSVESVKDLIFNLLANQSTEEVEFVIFNKGEAVIRRKISEFNYIDIVERENYVEIVLKSEKEIVE